MEKYYLIRTTRHGIEYRRTKCLDYWSTNKAECWQFSKQGAEKIAKRLNEAIPERMKMKVHYNILKA